MVIYDFGANKGQNLKYYLSKKCKVIAIEANPELCLEIQNKFVNDIKNKNLVVLNYCLTDTTDNLLVDFYIHKKRNVLSQFSEPNTQNINNYKKIQVLSRRPSSIIKEYGEPYYIKIDLEHYDLNVLKELISSNIVSKYLSVEAHNKDILETLLQSNFYSFYNLVKADNMKLVYNRFKLHSAGPFGNDLISPWLDKNDFYNLINKIGYGWIDIHVSNDKNLTYGKINTNYYVIKESTIMKIIRLVKSLFINKW